MTLSLPNYHSGEPVTCLSITSSIASRKNTTVQSTLKQMSIGCLDKVLILKPQRSVTSSTTSRDWPSTEELSSSLPTPTFGILCFQTLLSAKICKIGLTGIAVKTQCRKHKPQIMRKHVDTWHIWCYVTSERSLEVIRWGRALVTRTSSHPFSGQVPGHVRSACLAVSESSQWQMWTVDFLPSV